MKKITLLLILSFGFFATYSAPLIGAYTINSAVATGGTNFQSFTAFADSINLNGVSGNVTVTVTPGSGPYTERVSIDNVQGTSASAMVTIDGSNETITMLTDTAYRFVFRMKNLQYFTVTNLRVERQPTATSGFYGIHIFESGDHITVTNCVIDMAGGTSTLIGGIIASGDSASILVAGDFNNITISHDTCISGGYGASLFGLPSLSRGIEITDNVIYDFSSNGIYIRETDSIVIARNVFDKRTSNFTTTNAIQLAQSANINARIYDNQISLTQTNNGTQTFRGIYLFNGLGHRVYNNVISNINIESGNFTAIEVRTGSTQPEIYFNTISIDDQDTSTGEVFAFKESLNNTGMKLMNNIVSITKPSLGISAGIALSSGSIVTSAVMSDYNNFWVPNASVAIKDAGATGNPTYYNTLNDWQVVSMQDSNSLAVDPQFISPTQSIPANLILDGQGTTVSYIANDILGNARALTPDMGAYEWIPTGITETMNVSKLELYPNPAIDYFSLGISNQEFEMEIFNAIGEKVLSKRIMNHETGKRYSVDFLKRGIYYVRINCDGEIYRGKIILE